MPLPATPRHSRTLALADTYWSKIYLSMNMFTEIAAEKLPSKVLAQYSKEQTLDAYYNKLTEKYIIWVINPATKRQRELEFDVKSNRFVDISERQARLSLVENITYPQLGVSVAVDQHLDTETEALCESLHIYPIGSSEEIANCSYMVFSGISTDKLKHVEQALEKASFPIIYNSWSQLQRINYWAEVLYRMRRQAGEDGADEDCVFSSALVEQFKKVEPNIMVLLPAILTELANMEMTAASPIFAAFSARTQIELAEPA